MLDLLLWLGILFIVIAVVLLILGFISRVAWTIEKWLIIIFLVLAVIFLII